MLCIKLTSRVCMNKYKSYCCKNRIVTKNELFYSTLNLKTFAIVHYYQSVSIGSDQEVAQCDRPNSRLSTELKRSSYYYKTIPYSRLMFCFFL